MQDGTKPGKLGEREDFEQKEDLDPRKLFWESKWEREERADKEQ